MLLKTIQKMNDIRGLYPEEWVLLANPEINGDLILNGEVLFHHKSKKTVLRAAQKESHNHKMIKIVYAGDLAKNVSLNIFKVVEKA